VKLVNNPPYVSATYVSPKATCPRSCVYYDAGCYAQEGKTRKAGQRLDAAAGSLNVVEVAEEEAKWVTDFIAENGGRVPDDGLGRPRALRLHVLGDAGSEDAARVLARTATAWQLHGGGACWTYTHRYTEFPRTIWGSISVLASVETNEQEDVAVKHGYVPARTCEAFPDGGNLFRFRGSSIVYVPCPHEVAGQFGRTCVECRLCWDDENLRSKNYGIAFAIHGPLGTRRAATTALTRAGAERPIPIRRSRTGPSLTHGSGGGAPSALASAR
jgi:hypothetical protein